MSARLRKFEVIVARVGDRGRWVLVAAWYGLIFSLSQAPGTDHESTYRLLDSLALGDLNGLARTAAHMTLFGVLACLVFVALGRGSLAAGRFVAASAFGVTVLLAMSDELHQHFMPLRHGRVEDVLIDAVGASLGLLLLLLVGRRLGVTAAVG
jgi:VanZ family protein